MVASWLSSLHPLCEDGDAPVARGRARRVARRSEPVPLVKKPVGVNPHVHEVGNLRRKERQRQVHRPALAMLLLNQPIEFEPPKRVVIEMICAESLVHDVSPRCVLAKARFVGRGGAERSLGRENAIRLHQKWHSIRRVPSLKL